MREVSDLANRLKQLKVQADLLNRREVLVGWDITDYKMIEDLQKQLSPYVDLWEVMSQYQSSSAQWKYGPMFSFNLENVENQVTAASFPLF